MCNVLLCRARNCIEKVYQLIGSYMLTAQMMMMMMMQLMFVWLMNVVLAVMKSNLESVSVSHEYSNGGLVGSHYLFCQTVKSTIGFILVFIQFNNCMFQAQQMFIGFNNDY